MSLTEKRTFSKVSFACALALILSIALLYLYNIIKWGDYPDFGFYRRIAAGVGIVGVVTEPGRKAGIQVGDHILNVNGKTFKNIKEFRSALNHELGDQNTYVVERTGNKFEVSIINTPLGVERAFIISGLPYLMGLCYILIGTLVFLMKPYQRTSWIFFLFAATQGLLLKFLFTLGELKPFWLGTLNIYLFTLAPAAFIHLALTFPEERSLIKKHPTVQLLPYLISTALFLCIRSVTPEMMGTPKTWFIILTAYLLVAFLVFLGSCFQLWLTSQSEIVKLRSKMILLGVAIAASIPILDTLINTLLQVYIVPTANYYLPFLIVFPLSIGYSIVKHNLFDIDAVIKRTVGYALMTALVGGTYFSIQMVIRKLVLQPLIGRYVGELYPVIFSFLIVFFFNPVRNRIQKTIDRIFYRLEYDYQETVQRISEALRSLLHLDEIGKSIIDHSVGVMFIESGSVLVLNPKEQVYESITEPSFQLKIPGDDPLIQKISTGKKEVTLYDIQEDPLFEKVREACKKTFEALKATLIVPLIYEDRLTGLISLGGKKSGKFYRREDINLLKTLANQGAVAIENARLFDENIEKSRMEEELKIAHNIQLSMLPDKAPTIEGFSIAARSIPAREVGGDFYDFIEITENGSKRLGIVVGDVSGKAVSGALVMAASRSIFRVLTETHESVEEVMNRGNVRLYQDVKKGMFVALLYAVLDPQKKTLTFSNAGQVQPILCPHDRSKPLYIDSEGDRFPLGIVKDCHYQETCIPIKEGDTIVFYTDGMVEAVNDKNELYGFDRFLSSIDEGRELSAEDQLEKLIGDVLRFVGQVEQHDDLTTVVVKVE
jgi:serine phosphatase RsbU (regulator of sigma subunit)